MTTLYQIVLSAGGFDDLPLPVSSFTWQATSETFTGSMVVEGFDLAAGINDRLAGTLTLSRTVDGSATEILTASIDRIDSYISTTSEKYTILFDTGVWSQTAYATAYAIDSLVSFAALQDSTWSWRIPAIDPQLQEGITVEYNGIDYFIGDMNAFYSGDGFGYVTINQGDETPTNNCYVYDALYPCGTEGFTIGNIVNTNFSSACSSGYDSATDQTFISPEGYRYDMYVFRCYQFTITEETAIHIEFLTGLAYLNVSGVSSGFEFSLIQGVYTPFTKASVILSKTRGDGEFNSTLPAGIYTCKLALYIDRTVDSLAWITRAFSLYVSDSTSLTWTWADVTAGITYWSTRGERLLWSDPVWYILAGVSTSYLDAGAWATGKVFSAIRITHDYTPGLTITPTGTLGTGDAVLCVSGETVDISPLYDTLFPSLLNLMFQEPGIPVTITKIELLEGI